MKLFQLTSKNFVGYITLLYDDGEKLAAVNFEDAQLTLDQTEKLLPMLPAQVNGIEPFINKFPQLKMVEGSFDITWERFYNEYDKKINPLRARPKWEKLKAVDKVNAFYGIKKYNRFLEKEGRKKADPENYIAYRYWENEY